MAQEPDPCNTEKGVTACVALEVGEPARACWGVEESSTEHGDAKPQQEMHQADGEPDLECGGKQLTTEEVPDQHAALRVQRCTGVEEQTLSNEARMEGAPLGDPEDQCHQTEDEHRRCLPTAPCDEGPTAEP